MKHEKGQGWSLPVGEHEWVETCFDLLPVEVRRAYLSIDGERWAGQPVWECHAATRDGGITLFRVTTTDRRETWGYGGAGTREYRAVSSVPVTYPGAN